MEDLVSQHKERDVDEEFIRTYWVRIFQHVKKKYDVKEKKFISDKQAVDWLKISDGFLNLKTRISEARVEQLTKTPP